jgi:hypothetical protein
MAFGAVTSRCKQTDELHFQWVRLDGGESVVSDGTVSCPRDGTGLDETGTELTYPIGTYRLDILIDGTVKGSTWFDVLPCPTEDITHYPFCSI